MNTNIHQISILLILAMLVMSNSELLGFGNNNVAQLGIGVSGQYSTPILHPYLSAPVMRVRKISSFDKHTLVLTEDGEVFTFGSNLSGELAFSPKTKRINLPTLIPNLSRVIDISAGSSYSMIRMADNTLAAFGYNSHGQLGIYSPETINTHIPTPVVDAIRNKIYVQAICTGFHHSMAIEWRGLALYTWGGNVKGQMGIPGIALSHHSVMNPTFSFDNNTYLHSIACGQEHSLVLTLNGTLYSFGENMNGQLGVGPNISFSKIPMLVPLLPKIEKISASRDGSHVISSIGMMLYVWGGNSLNQLGIPWPSAKKIVFPTLHPIFQTLAVFDFSALEHGFTLLNDGSLYAHGINSQGQLGLGDTRRRPIPTLHKSVNSKNIKAIYTCPSRTFILTTDRRCQVMGENYDSSMGIGITDKIKTPSIIPTFSKSRILQVASTFDFSLFLTQAGEVYSVGQNDNGQLGLGDSNSRVIPELIKSLPKSITKVSCGFQFAYALSREGEVFSWGMNGDDQLGHGDQQFRYAPEVIKGLVRIRSISAGVDHGLFLNEFGDIWVVGSNDQYQLGVPSIGRAPFPHLLQTLKDVVEVHAGLHRSFAIDYSGRLYSWGKLESYTLCHPEFTGHQKTPLLVSFFDENTRISKVQSINTHTMISTSDGKLFGCGYANSGQLGLNITSLPQPKQIGISDTVASFSTAQRHSLVLTKSGKLFVMGSNDFLQLGIEHEIPLGSILPITELENPQGYKILSIHTGDTSSFIDITFECFGKGSYENGVCSNNGMCIGKNRCLCNTNWYGSSCDITKCFEKFSNETTVCNQGGSCSLPDTCNCKNGFLGTQCAEFTCFGVSARNSSSCNGKGPCKWANQCQCNDGYLPPSCQDWICNGIFKNDSRVCSGANRGECVAPNSCECHTVFFVGTNCDQLMGLSIIFWTIILIFGFCCVGPLSILDLALVTRYFKNMRESIFEPSWKGEEKSKTTQNRELTQKLLQ